MVIHLTKLTIKDWKKKIAENVKKFLIDSMKTWKTELTSLGERLGVIHIR